MVFVIQEQKTDHLFRQQRPSRLRLPNNLSTTQRASECRLICQEFSPDPFPRANGWVPAGDLGDLGDGD